MPTIATRRSRDARRCPTCDAPLYGKKAEVYLTARAHGRIERTCKPCKIATVTKRHRHKMESDRQYAEAQHKKLLAYHKARRLYAIRAWKQREATESGTSAEPVNA